jgi:hypothetical protein
MSALITVLLLAGAPVPPPVISPPEYASPPYVRPAPAVLQRPAAAEKAPAPADRGAPLFGAVPLITWITPTDGKRLFEERGGRVTAAEETEGGFVLHATVPQETFVSMQGLDCRGAGESKRCAMYVFEAAFQMENDARAAQLERELSLNYVADRASGPVYSIWRMGTVLDGVTEAQVRNDLDRFMQLVWTTASKAWPNTAPAASDGSAGPAPDRGDPTLAPIGGPAPRVNTRTQFVRTAD